MKFVLKIFLGIQQVENANVYYFLIIACLSGCRFCSNNYRCDECTLPYAVKFDEEKLADDCLKDCGMRYYMTVDRICKKCDFRCVTCVDDKNTGCPTCDLSLKGVIRTLDNKCDCDEGYIVNFRNGTCECILSLN